MGTTPQLQLPYPDPNDPNDVPADIEALADRVEAVVLQRLVDRDDARLVNARTPNGPAGGVLNGNYPDPALANGAIGSTTPFSGAMLDGLTAAPSLRSLGTGPRQAAPGDHSHFGGDRDPTVMAMPSAYWSGTVRAERRLGWVEVDVTVLNVKNGITTPVIATLTDPFRPKRVQFATALANGQVIELYVTPDGAVAVSQYPTASDTQVRCNFVFLAASTA